MNHLSPLWLIAIFLLSAVVIWIAGIYLSRTTDTLAKKLHLGQALGGLIILAIVTNLPEIAITISASLQDKTELAVGNLLGGIAIQTVVLVALDAFGLGKKGSLMSRSSSLEPALEALLVIAVLTIVVIGHQLPADIVFLRMTPSVVLIAICWVAGLYLIGKAKKDLPWQLKNAAPPPPGNAGDKQKSSNQNTGKVVLIFFTAALATLVAGVALEKSGDALSKVIGLDGVLFGATILAAATSLPELSTGLASVKQKDYDLAISDIFGGNSFLPVLFLLATLCSGKAVLPAAQTTDIYLTALGIMVSMVYVWGILFRPKKQVMQMGIDSLLVLLIYLVGVVGLFFVAKT